jgi:lipid-A-disaccharide synthase-like uncharacterized protein
MSSGRTIAALAFVAVLLPPEDARAASWLNRSAGPIEVDCPQCGTVFEVDVDALEGGLPWYWLAFGFGAQALFTARFVVQWLATERAKRSVVPTAFWIFSILGSVGLFTYAARRGDPVIMLGQAFGSFVYFRNLVFIRRQKEGGPPGGDGGSSLKPAAAG